MIGLDDVAELRALLRRADPVARNFAYGLIDSWSGSDLDEVGARALLEAAAGGYPRVDGDHRHPGESLTRVLWERPRIVPVDDVLRAFLIADERARRGFIHLLALRRDVAGLAAVESLFADDGPHEMVPVALMPVLDPLLDAGHRDRFVTLLCRVLQRDGWVWHAASLLCRLQQEGPSRRGEQEQIRDAVSQQVDELVDAADRAYALVSSGGVTSNARFETLASVCRVLDELDGVDRAGEWLRLLGSADPRVGALGATRMLGAGLPLAPERLGLIARDLVARAELFDGLAAYDAASTLQDVVDEVEVNEALLARWLSDVTELGRVPDEIEFLCTRSGPSAPEKTDRAAVLFVYRFRLNAPHWSSARGWMIGVAGPWTGTCYLAEDEADLDGHIEEIRSSLATWPGRSDPGAA